MLLTPEDLAEFKAIYEAEVGNELSDAEAEQRASQLLCFYELVYRALVATVTDARSISTVDEPRAGAMLDRTDGS